MSSAYSAEIDHAEGRRFNKEQEIGITTHSPAVTDVFESGRNVGALRPGRRVGFRCLVPGLADDICRRHYYFCNAYSS